MGFRRPTTLASLAATFGASSALLALPLASLRPPPGRHPLCSARRTAAAVRAPASERLEPEPKDTKGSMEDAMQSATYYEDKYCPPDEAMEEMEICDLPEDDNFMVAILGDLHLDPRKLPCLASQPMILQRKPPCLASQ